MNEVAEAYRCQRHGRSETEVDAQPLNYSEIESPDFDTTRRLWRKDSI